MRLAMFLSNKTYLAKWLVHYSLPILTLSLACGGNEGPVIDVDGAAGAGGSGLGGRGVDEGGTDASPPDGSSPVKMFPRLAVGNSFGCAIDRGGIARCWGEPQIDVGQTNSPQVVLAGVWSTSNCTQGIDSLGNLVSWGAPESVCVDRPRQDLVDIFQGNSGGCAVKADGSLTCWGSRWTSDPPPPGMFSRVAVTAYDACALDDSGEPNCWGRSREIRLAPPKGERFLQIVAGDLHFCALSVTNKVHCWGIGIPTDPNDTSSSDTVFRGQASPPDGDFTYLASGRYHSCAIRTNGSTVCWGYNESGQAQPIQEQFIEIDGGFSNTCGITKDLRVVCWGSNTGNRSTPPADLKL